MPIFYDNRQVAYGGFWPRLFAYLLDLFIVLIGLLVVRLFLFVIMIPFENTPIGGQVLYNYTIKDIVLYGSEVSYFILCTYYTGTTLGKRAMNLRVISGDGDGRLPFLDVLYRETIGRFLSGVFFCMGYFMAGVDKEKRGLHDMLCNTRVVYRRENMGSQIICRQPEQSAAAEPAMPPEPSMQPEPPVQSTPPELSRWNDQQWP